MKDSPRSSVHRIGMRLFAAHLAALVVAVGSVTSASLADTLYVDASAPAGGDGASWNSAHRFLQNALFAAGPGSGVSEIRIAQGAYKPDRTEANPQGTGNREASFNLIGGVTLRGGYAGLAGTDPDERDIAAFETILSGDLLGNDGPDFTGMGDNSYRVVHALNLTSPATLDGLTIASGNGSTTSGGGLRSTESQLIIRDCTFRSNRASGAGGGGAVFRSNSTAEIYRCTFDTNRAFEGPGGGMFTTSNSCVTLADSIFTNNESLFGGAPY